LNEEYAMKKFLAITVLSVPVAIAMLAFMTSEPIAQEQTLTVTEQPQQAIVCDDPSKQECIDASVQATGGYHPVPDDAWETMGYEKPTE
jgi:uncharacterized protein YfaQ (DUF2300 family)